jgi:SAM-dependent methyltransferase
MAEPNAEQRAYWNEQAGPGWVENQERLDAQIRAHGRVALEALAPTKGEAILDVGCGCGDSTLTLGERVGPDGRVLGIDLSAPMLARARERAAAAGLRHVAFEQADAQVRPFAGDFDGVFSRFGVMFFESPEKAFANLRTALRPGGRLAFACWRAPQLNPWLAVPAAAAAPLLPPRPPLDPLAPGPFAFADGSRVERILASAGFAAIAVEAVDVPMSLASLDEASAFMLEIGPVGAALREAKADDALRERVRLAVREALSAHTVDGVTRLGSSIWRVTARNP